MKKVIIISFVLVLSFLAACSDGGENAQESESSGKYDSRSITIEDAMGKQTIEGTPKKIVALEWSYAENLLALGIQPAGVADLDGFHQWVNIEKEFDDSVKDVGTRQEPNLEAISRLNPDLIIAVKFRHEQYLDKLKKIAPVVTFAPYSKKAADNHFQHMTNEFKTLAKIAGKQEEAKQALTDMNTFIEQQKKRVADAGLNGEKYVAAQAFTAQNTPTIRIFTDNSMVAQIMNKLGFKNAYESDKTEIYGYTQAGVEALQTFQNENLQFLYIVQNQDNIFENQLKGNPVWENLSFVKNGNTHKLPGDTWTFGGVLSAQVLAEQLANAMVKE
ncbi:ABC transporter substrate-binding protein [Virgibacillus siamensis]|uniref:ABC transporter substrate-binding protein n=1 Tax=Virgibacillus siamensis TaxID=480071 RepID=UPI00098666E2|nr:iron-siderophore ABC transporter substrate-binding protein [Virgibacillus siamensis]